MSSTAWRGQPALVNGDGAAWRGRRLRRRTRRRGGALLFSTPDRRRRRLWPRLRLQQRQGPLPVGLRLAGHPPGGCARRGLAVGALPCHRPMPDRLHHLRAEHGRHVSPSRYQRGAKGDAMDSSSGTSCRLVLLLPVFLLRAAAVS